MTASLKLTWIETSAAVIGVTRVGRAARGFRVWPAPVRGPFAVIWSPRRDDRIFGRSDHVAIAAADRAGDAHPFAIVTADLKLILAPASVGPIDREAGIVVSPDVAAAPLGSEVCSP